MTEEQKMQLDIKALKDWLKDCGPIEYDIRNIHPPIRLEYYGGIIMETTIECPAEELLFATLPNYYHLHDICGKKAIAIASQHLEEKIESLANYDFHKWECNVNKSGDYKIAIRIRESESYLAATPYPDPGGTVYNFNKPTRLITLMAAVEMLGDNQ